MRKTGGKSRESEYVPLPYSDSDDFPKDLLLKREFRLGEARQGCDANAPFKLQPVQQFVSTFMSPVSPYKSILLFHGTGVGKTCAAVQAAELQGGASRRTLVLVPTSIQGGFENNVYNANKVVGESVADASKFQCTGSSYYSQDLEGQNKASIRKTQRTKVRRRYEFMGHDRFANAIEAIEARIRRDFAGLGSDAVETELVATLRSIYDKRLIVVDETHSLRSDTGSKPSYERLKQVLRACTDVRLILMSATPMYNRATEIVDIVNLMRVNDGLPELPGTIFGSDNRLTLTGRQELRAALKGRVSHMTYEDPASFPALLWPTDAGLSGSAWEVPYLTRKGETIPQSDRLDKGGGEFELFCSPLSKEQRASYSYRDKRGASSVMSDMQLENVCYDGSSTATNEEAFIKAFKKVPGYGGRVFRYSGCVRYLHPENIDRYAPKIGAATRLMKNADGLCFMYSTFRWSGVFPAAIALEEMGFLPYNSRPLLQDAPAFGSVTAPRYVIITKDDESSDAMSVSDKVDAANDPSNNIKVVLGTETASQGLDFKCIREVHILDPWWNMSRLRQVIGRGIRRCSHVTLPEEKRNTTVYLHCTCGDYPKETLDQRIYREAFNKNAAIREVEAVLAESAIDCGLYETRARDVSAPVLSAQGTQARPRASAASTVTCAVKWPKASEQTEQSTLHPYVYKNMIDLLAFDVKEHLTARRAASFEEIKEATRADDLVLSLALTTLMNPLASWRWLGDRRMVYRGNLYAVVPEHMADQPFTMVEARMGFLFSDNPSAKITGA